MRLIGGKRRFNRIDLILRFSMSLEDASWIEARKLSVIEVCRLFRVPPVIVQAMDEGSLVVWRHLAD